MSRIITIKNKYSNAYLIEYKESEYILVDGDYGFNYNEFTTKINECGVVIPQIKYVVLTHIHAHNAGTLRDFLHERECPIIYRTEDTLRLQSGKNNYNTFVTDFIRLMISKTLIFFEKYNTFNTVRTDNYIDPTTQPFKQYGIEFLFLSGHTKYDLQVLVDNTLICGDICSTGPQSYRYAPYWIYNKFDMVRSWEEILSNENIKEIAPTHGKTFDKTNLASPIEFWKKRGVFRLLPQKKNDY
ncbi:MAG: MBL fold metallo-hydrolase [Clostridia bacterium]|nr:MBL fold metallo-hydrolase [Clostridia bacterium]